MSQPEQDVARSAPAPSEVKESAPVDDPLKALIDKATTGTTVGKKPESRARALDSVAAFLRLLGRKEVEATGDLDEALGKAISQIDQTVSAQLNEVYQHPEFRSLEASWRGLHRLVNESPLRSNSNINIKVMSMSRQELQNDVGKNRHDVERSVLYDRVYRKQLGIAGGTPTTAIVVDAEFDHDNASMDVMEGLASIGRQSQAVILTGAGPALLGVESFADLHPLTDYKRRFKQNEEYARWREFRRSVESLYVGVCMPHFLTRAPHKPAPYDKVAFLENVTGNDSSKLLWGNAAYLLAARLANSYARTGWGSSIEGKSGGGEVKNLPQHTFKGDGGQSVLACPTEFAIDKKLEMRLAENGLIPFTWYKGETTGVFLEVPTAHVPDEGTGGDALMQAKLTSTLLVARFTHALHQMVYDRYAGSKTDVGDIQRQLRQWIAKYTAEEAPAHKVDEYPLKYAQIDLEEEPERPGELLLKAELTPRVGLRKITAAVRISAKKKASDA